uniref:Uncharacterized protein n=1 Tax=Peronospora matthiolae TaxID=2874970 RepID=A0AAV1UMZ9_9STRA
MAIGVDYGYLEELQKSSWWPLHLTFEKNGARSYVFKGEYGVFFRKRFYMLDTGNGID